MKKVYEASDGTVSVYFNNVLKTYNSFEEADIDDLEFLEAKYILLKDIQPFVKIIDEDNFEISFQNGRIEKIKKSSIYLKDNHYKS